MDRETWGLPEPLGAPGSPEVSLGAIGSSCQVKPRMNSGFLQEYAWNILGIFANSAFEPWKSALGVWNNPLKISTFRIEDLVF
jgi:hypothetical protein